MAMPEAGRTQPGCNAAGKQRKQRLEQHKIKRRTAVQKQNGIHDNNIGKPQLHGGHQAKKRGKHGFQKRERHGKGKQHAKQGGLSGFVVLQGGFLHYFIKLHGFCISKCKVAGGVCQAPVFLRKIVDVKVCEIYPAGLEKQV